MPYLTQEEYDELEAEAASAATLRAERDNLAAANAELREALETIRSRAHSAIGYVAAANYPERENEAHQSVNDCIDAVLAKGAK